MDFRKIILGLIVCGLCRGSASADCGLSIGSAQKVGEIQSKDIAEASGLAASWRNPGVFWTHNDGSSGKVFAIDLSGRLLAIFKLGKSVDDVEDLAVGPGPQAGVSYLYVGDIGSNSADRDEVRVLRVAEPPVALGDYAGSDDFKGVEVFHLQYPSGKFDAEALMIDPLDRQLLIATKEDEGSHLFGIGLDILLAGEKATLNEMVQLAFARISAGDISADGRMIAMRREDEGHYWRRAPGQSILGALSGPVKTLPVVGPPEEPNGEALAFLPDFSGYVTTSEGEQQPLYFFPISAGTEAPEFAAVGRSGLSVVLEIIACPGSRVAVERSADLAHWATAEEFVAGRDRHTFTDSPGRAAFYRLRLP